MREAQSKACPVCGKEQVLQFKPFCSRRCAQIDLGRWFGEGYVVQTEEEPEQDDQ